MRLSEKTADFQAFGNVKKAAKRLQINQPCIMNWAHCRTWSRQSANLTALERGQGGGGQAKPGQFQV